MKKPIIIIAIIAVVLISVGAWSYLRPSIFTQKLSYFRDAEIAKENAGLSGNSIGEGAPIPGLSEVNFVYGVMSEDVYVDILAHGLVFAMGISQEYVNSMMAPLYEKYGVTEEDVMEFMPDQDTESERFIRIGQKLDLRRTEVYAYYREEITAQQQRAADNISSLIEEEEDLDF